MEFLNQLKAFLADRPETALLAVSLFVNSFLFMAYARARDAHVKALMTLLPLATRLSDLLTAAATRAKNRNSPPFTSKDSGLQER